LTKLPVSKLLTAKVMVKFVLAGIVSPFLGLVNLQDGWAVLAGIEPIGTGLQLPPVTCSPFVIGWLTDAQKLMKLFVLVKEATCPGSPPARPFSARFEPIRAGSSCKEDCSPPSSSELPVEFDEDAAVTLAEELVVVVDASVDAAESVAAALAVVVLSASPDVLDDFPPFLPKPPFADVDFDAAEVVVLAEPSPFWPCW